MKIIKKSHEYFSYTMKQTDIQNNKNLINLFYFKIPKNVKLKMCKQLSLRRMLRRKAKMNSYRHLPVTFLIFLTVAKVPCKRMPSINASNSKHWQKFLEKKIWSKANKYAYA